MKGLLLKDLYCMKQMIKSLIFILVIWGMVFLPGTDGGLFLISLCMMISAMFVFTLASYDKQAQWDTYALTMPLTRANMVQEKYSMAILLLFLSAALSCSMVTLAWLIRTGGLSGDFIGSMTATLAAGTGLSLFYSSLSLPLSMWLGVEKARYIPSMLFVAIFFTGFFIARTRGLWTVDEERLITFGIMALILSVVLFIISYFISLHIYKKKEF